MTDRESKIYQLESRCNNLEYVVNSTLKSLQEHVVADLQVQKETRDLVQALVVEKETIRATLRVWGMVFSAFLVIITPVITAFLIGVFKG